MFYKVFPSPCSDIATSLHVQTEPFEAAQTFCWHQIQNKQLFTQFNETDEVKH